MRTVPCITILYVASSGLSATRSMADRLERRLWKVRSQRNPIVVPIEVPEGLGIPRPQKSTQVIEALPSGMHEVRYRPAFTQYHPNIHHSHRILRTTLQALLGLGLRWYGWRCRCSPTLFVACSHGRQAASTSATTSPRPRILRCSNACSRWPPVRSKEAEACERGRYVV